MIDHFGFAVADYQRSKAFYERALAPLGFTLLMEFDEAAAALGREDDAYVLDPEGNNVEAVCHQAA
jgi:catechol 2,3-dioxygenase-like lactoylglutathione lyase family enzyme